MKWARKIRSGIAKEANKKLMSQLVRVKILGNKIAILKDAVSQNSCLLDLIHENEATSSWVTLIGGTILDCII